MSSHPISTAARSVKRHPTAELEREAKRAKDKRRRRLPEDVVFEILLGLPSRSIFSLRYACKLFYAITSDNSFIRSARREPHSLILQTMPSNPPPNSMDLKLIHIKDGEPSCRIMSHTSLLTVSWQILGFRPYLRISCDGLLCFSEFNHNYKTRRLFICNPLTRKWRQVEGSPPGYLCAFYYHNSTGDYRLIKLSRSKAQSFVFNVYSLRTKVWRRIHNSPYRPPYLSCKVHFPLNDKLYWENRRNNTLVVFDIESEMFSEMVLPWRCRSCKNLLMAVDGRLAVFVIGEHLPYLEVWVLKDSRTAHWDKMYSIKKEDIPEPNGVRRIAQIKALWAPKDGQVVLGWVEVGKLLSSLVVYDVKLKSFRRSRVGSLDRCRHQIVTCAAPFVYSPYSFKTF